MPIKAQTTEAQIDAVLGAELDKLDKVIIRNLSYIGEQVVNIARDWPMQTKPYTDRTGNLRSSVGYVIVRDGEVVQISDFKVVKEGNKGKSEGMSFSKSLASEFPVGYALIVVAGMNYAFYVKKRGYDVLDSAELLAARLVPKMLEQLQKHSKN